MLFIIWLADIVFRPTPVIQELSSRGQKVTCWLTINVCHLLNIRRQPTTYKLLSLRLSVSRYMLSTNTWNQRAARRAQKVMCWLTANITPPYSSLDNNQLDTSSCCLQFCATYIGFRPTPEIQESPIGDTH